MRILLMGAPGAGKGTQAKLLSEQLNIPEISTGDILRNNIRNRTPMGESVKTYLESGLLVPDEFTVALVRDRLDQADCKDGFILDGFPRTLAQALCLETITDELSIAIDNVINFRINDELIVNRLSGRRVCKSCGKTYHMEHLKPLRDGVCDHCDTVLDQREDDREEIVRKRLGVYHRQTKPLIQYYRQKNLLLEVDATRQMTEVVSEVLRSIHPHR